MYGASAFIVSGNCGGYPVRERLGRMSGIYKADKFVRRKPASSARGGSASRPRIKLAATRLCEFHVSRKAWEIVHGRRRCLGPTGPQSDTAISVCSKGLPNGKPSALPRVDVLLARTGS